MCWRRVEKHKGRSEMMDFRKLAEEYEVELSDCPNDHWCRNGAHSAGNRISMHPCDEEYMYEISFWHELGHVVLSRLMSDRTHYMSTMSTEGAAWELGFIEAAKHGRIWAYDSEEMCWARKQMASYVNGEYDDLKKYYRF